MKTLIKYGILSLLPVLSVSCSGQHTIKTTGAASAQGSALSTGSASGQSGGIVGRSMIPGGGAAPDPKASWSAVSSIITSNCASCHNGVIQSIDLSSYAAVMASGTVVAGNAPASTLYITISGGNSKVPPMPIGSTLSASDVAAIAYWIKAGAQLGATATPAPTAAPVGGGSTSGYGSVRIPDADTIGARLVMGLEGNVSLDPTTTTGKAFKAMYGGLPQQPNPNSATGVDQVPILIYTACASVKPSSYSIDTSQSVTNSRAALIAAGLRMLNLHVGGLLSQDSSLNSQVSTAFGSLVDSDSAAGASTQTTFISVCMAANTYGIVMKGF